MACHTETASRSWLRLAHSTHQCVVSAAVTAGDGKLRVLHFRLIRCKYDQQLSVPVTTWDYMVSIKLQKVSLTSSVSKLVQNLSHTDELNYFISKTTQFRLPPPPTNALIPFISSKYRTIKRQMWKLPFPDIFFIGISLFK